MMDDQGIKPGTLLCQQLVPTVSLGGLVERAFVVSMNAVLHKRYPQHESAKQENASSTGWH
jgi:hypothetical protein